MKQSAMTRFILTLRRYRSLFLLLLVAAGIEALSELAEINWAFTSANAGSAIDSRDAIEDSRLGLRFELNKGQGSAGTDYISHGAGYLLSLASTEATLTLRKPSTNADEHRRHTGRLRSSFATREGQLGQPAKPASVTLRLKLLGANPHAEVSGLDPLSCRVNYVSGQDRSKWQTNIPTYARVKYRDVYDGIDLTYYGNSLRQLEYDFQVAPDANPGSIVMRYDGVIAGPHYRFQRRPDTANGRRRDSPKEAIYLSGSSGSSTTNFW